MIEIYIVDGTEYKVGPKSKAKFLQDFPNAKLISGSSIANIGKKEPDEINWFNEAFGDTWFGRGFQAASTTGEANALWGARSKVTRETVRKFVEAKKNEAEVYIPSVRMQKFQKKYKEYHTIKIDYEKLVNIYYFIEARFVWMEIKDQIIKEIYLMCQNKIKKYEKKNKFISL